MKKEVTKTEYAIHYVNEELSILEQHWTNHENKMTTDEYKVDMFNYLKFVEKYQIQNALINTFEFGFTIIPDIQEWIDTNIAEKANKIVKKIAFVLPTDIFTQVSIQQTMEENEGGKYQNINYFDKIEDAYKWLIA